MQKNVSSQKLIVYAWDSTTNLPKTGDATNITAYVSKDYGSVTVLGDTSATEMDSTNAKGFYLFDLTQAETNADTLLFSAKSGTSNVVVLAMPATVFTTPANFSKQSIDSNGRLDIINVNGTAQTARDLGASVLVAGDFSATMKTSIGTAVAASAVASVTAGVTVTTNNDKAGYSLTQSFPSNFALLAIDGSGDVTFNNAGVATAANQATIYAAFGTLQTHGDSAWATATGFATPTNITAGTMTTVTNLTNAPTAGDFTAAMKTSLSAATPTVTLADGAITDAKFTVPTVTSTASGPVGYLFQLWRRFFKQSSKDPVTGNLKTYADDNTTVMTTQTVTVVGNVTTVGPAS